MQKQKMALLSHFLIPLLLIFHNKGIGRQQEGELAPGTGRTFFAVATDFYDYPATTANGGENDQE